MDEYLPTASDPADFTLHTDLLSTPQIIKDLLHEFSDVVHSDRFTASTPAIWTLTN